MRHSKVVNLLHEVNTLNDIQVSEVMNYVKRLKHLKEIAKPTGKSMAMLEIRKALKQEYSF